MAVKTHFSKNCLFLFVFKDLPPMLGKVVAHAC